MNTSSIKGYIYILYHESFQYYGEHIYKIGWTIDTKSRMKGYTTSFLSKCKFLYISECFQDGYKAERLLFYLLRRERLAKNREFFCIELERCKEMIQRLEHLDKINYLDKCYHYMCNQIIPYTVEKALQNGEDVSTSVKELESKFNSMSLSDFIDICGVDLFLEQFRFRPKDRSLYPGYIFPEQEDINKILSNLEPKRSYCENEIEKESESESED